MTITATELPTQTLVPTDDPRPVEQAVVASITAMHPPETFLWIVFRNPDGSARVEWAWTSGGHELGNRIDVLAVAAELDSADYFEILGRSAQKFERGRAKVLAHPLRQVLADLEAGVRAPNQLREAYRNAVCVVEPLRGQNVLNVLDLWFGVGPTLLATRVR